MNIDGDNPEHISWICSRASERALKYGIQGVNYRLTQGVIKNIIPAVASTNAVIAGMFKPPDSPLNLEGILHKFITNQRVRKS